MLDIACVSIKVMVELFLVLCFILILRSSSFSGSDDGWYCWSDNKQRDPSMDSLKVTIDPKENTFSVYNNGDGIPGEIHQGEKVYVPGLIFGHFLTSSDYNDNVKKTTDGRNGYGAKLTNIFSTEFIIEAADGHRLKKYKQVFSNNMRNFGGHALMQPFSNGFMERSPSIFCTPSLNPAQLHSRHGNDYPNISAYCQEPQMLSNQLKRCAPVSNQRVILCCFFMRPGQG